MRPETLHAERTLLGALVVLIAAGALTAFASTPERSPQTEATAPRPEPIVYRGVASWYGEWFRGRTTACGTAYDPGDLTVAHRALACGTRLRVEHDDRSVVVTVTDRGPYVAGRHFDLSRAAFARLAPLNEGLLEVRAVRLPVPSA